MKFIVIILFLLVLELESASNNSINEIICQKQSNECRMFSTTCNGVNDDKKGQNSRSKRMLKETDTFQEICECICISTKTTSSNCSLNKITECIDSTTTDSHENLLTPSSMNHQALATTESLLPTATPTPSKQLLCNGSATNAFITQATALRTIVGLSAVIAVLLTLAIIGWVCTCLALKKKGSMNITKTNNSEMETRYCNEPGNTQQESNEDQLHRDLNDERAHLYDIIPPINNDTPAVVVHNTATTNMEEASTEQHTYTAPTKRQQIRSKNEPPGPLLPDRAVVEGSCDKGRNQTTLDGEAKRDQEDSTNTHIYHVLEQQSTKKEVELIKDDHKPPAAAYEIPVVNTAVSQP